LATPLLLLGSMLRATQERQGPGLATPLLLLG
jgi:hypothetical protein